MAIEFVVEDGTGKADATSYSSVADFRQYWENRGVDYTTATSEDAVKTALNQATEYIDTLHQWRGIRSTLTQALEFPRRNCFDDAGVDQSGDVPDGIKIGTLVAAGYFADGESFAVSLSNIRSKSMGPVSVTYGAGGEQQVRLPKAERAVGGLVRQMGVLR